MKYQPIIDSAELRKHYSKTLKDGVILLTAHSHQAWPDIIEEAQIKSVHKAYSDVDLKWDYIFAELVPEFQELVSERCGNLHPELIANSENTHDLVTRVMSCFKWDASTRIVTTDSEFHSVKRQLYRLKEEGVDVEFVPVSDKVTLNERFIRTITPETDLVIISSVFFNDGYVLQNIGEIINRARDAGALFLMDAYHHFNIRRLNISDLGDDIFVTAGGYKHAQGGEGAAWLKVPADCKLRPRITGWFADFDSFKEKEYPFPVKYGPASERFLGATRDISGLFRQTAALKFMNNMGLSVDCLEENNLMQTAYLIHLYDKYGLEEYGISLVSSRNDKERGPFLTLDTGSPERSYDIYKELWQNYKVLTDTRGNNLRIGPAPYTTVDEMDTAMESLQKVLIGS